MERYLIPQPPPQPHDTTPSISHTTAEPTTYRLAIVGSRHFTDQQYVDRIMAAYTAEHGMPSLVVSGGARGVDRLAEGWARQHRVAVRIFGAEWQRYGKAAGPIRNSAIVAAVDRVIAIHVNHSSGTADTIRKAHSTLPASCILVLHP